MVLSIEIGIVNVHKTEDPLTFKQFTIEALQKQWNMFRVNNKNTRTTSLKLF